MDESRISTYISQCFGKLDDDIQTYVASVLSSSADEFQSWDDVYEAVGEFLLELPQCNEKKTIQFCKDIFKLLDTPCNSSKSSGDSAKILNAPVSIEDATEFSDAPDTSSIWSVKTMENSLIDEDANAAIAENKKKSASTKKSDLDREASQAVASQSLSKRDTRLEASGNNMGRDIHIEDFDISFGNNVLFVNASLHLSHGRRYGLVGRNGIGKSTLMKMIANRSLVIPSHITILFVEQEVHGDETLVLDSVLESDVTLSDLRAKEKRCNAENDHAGLAKVYAALEAIDADKAPSRAAEILSGLGFSAADQKRTTKEFSGGWRMRVALARALFMRPDLLLLDEPTNMLDLAAIIWLETYLQDWPSTIFFVSHDRRFLSSVATDIYYVFARQLEFYKGNFDQFEQTRGERQKNQQKAYEAQKAYREHIQVFIDRFRYNANRAAQVQSKIKLLEKLPELEEIESESEVVLKFDDCEKLSPPILYLSEVSFWYGDKSKTIMENIDLSANLESRIAFVGRNGAGKTTLLKLLTGEINPSRGYRHAHKNLKIAYFTQHHVDQLELNVTPLELIAKRFPGSKDEYYRSCLGKFGVSGSLALRQLNSLSGGQKSRVAFALLNLQAPHFLILDEPTNHLDMESIDALAEALNNFSGGVIVVSHDEHLIKKTCKEVWLCKDRKVHVLEGGVTQYRKLLEKELI